MIEQRFGSWETALAKAKLPKPVTQDKLTGFARYIEETERQKAAYREKKVAKKQMAQQKIKEQKEKQSV